MKVSSAIVLFLLFLIGCVNPNADVAQYENWEPTPKEVAELEPEIRRYIFFNLSDQWPSPDATVDAVFRDAIRHETNAMKAITSMAMTSIPTPDTLTIENIPLMRYKRNLFGCHRKGRKLLCIGFLDREHYPDCNDAIVFGGFPYYFMITIDWDEKRIINHRPRTKQDAPRALSILRSEYDMKDE